MCGNLELTYVMSVLDDVALIVSEWISGWCDFGTNLEY